MADAFPGNSEAFFFRNGDLCWLSNRLIYPGITVISGQPRIGKSWLIGQGLRALAAESPETRIGFVRCSAQDSDNLLRVIEDAFARLRETATLIEQAKVIFNRNKGRWFPLVAKAIGQVLDLTQSLDAASGLVASALRGLLELKPGEVPRLKYEQGQQLVRALADIAQADRVVLVLDQWEQSEDLNFELEHLRNFCRDEKEWPKTHFLITIRPGGEAETALDALIREYGRFAEKLTLFVWNMESEPGERERLSQYLRSSIPACRAIENPENYLALIKGHPGVLDNWTRDINRDTMRSQADLAEVATQAHQGLFPEFGNKLSHLDDPSQKLCIRLALLPNLTRESWQALRPIILEGIEPRCLDRLYREKLLEQVDVPSFGHQTRSEFFQDWLIKEHFAQTGSECEYLIGRMARNIRNVSSEMLPHSSAMLALAIPAQRLQLDTQYKALCEAAMTLFGISPRGILRGEGIRGLIGKIEPGFAGLISLGLFNTLHVAKSEGDVGRRDGLLEELWMLSRSHAEDAAVRENLAMGLFNTLKDASSEGAIGRRDSLLEKLQMLFRSHAEDATVRESLAKGLFNTLYAANSEGAVGRRDALLDELRMLSRSHAEDAAVRESLAKGLFNSLNDTNSDGDAKRRDGVLDELRMLSRSHAEDAAVRESLANGLYNTLNDAKSKGDVGLRDALLKELRMLARSQAGDAVVRERLAKGLFNTLNDAKSEGDLKRRDALLKELQMLARSHDEDAAVREQLAKGMFNTLNDAKAEGDVGRRDALLEELRILSQNHAEDAAVREQLAKGLYNTLRDALSETDRKSLSTRLNTLFRPKKNEAGEYEWVFLTALAVSMAVESPSATVTFSRKGVVVRSAIDLARSLPDGNPHKLEILERLTTFEAS